jgi:hypothetical protein
MRFVMVKEAKHPMLSRFCHAERSEASLSFVMLSEASLCFVMLSEASLSFVRLSEAKHPFLLSC